MSVTYDDYYQTENLFGDPFPELIDFFATYPKKGKVLDLGCGQGRDIIPLARLGFSVTGVDYSAVGIEQLNEIAHIEQLAITGIVADIYNYSEFNQYDFVLLDSMFHFLKNDLEKEVTLIEKIFSSIQKKCVVVFCIQDTGKKVEVLKNIIEAHKEFNQLVDKKLEYVYEDRESGHKSITDYRMVVVRK